ncbi:metallophosphoesterase family protein [Sediminibacillus halophilus]|uniref:DNA repair exonuclease SbcCD nuclease subunit n=1 Tax=Sediminibacillus halophilus TaxID=482461 RepID=A0A1G9PQM1_9BACI|nr:DNA repair exonuclease [Sediminibacillus halophilus]SDM00913.1 DNA repair exonuclease SbcCD nuclease subunit [Sediminibacillus halophilus]
MAKEKISFLHSADLHLDSPFKGLGNVPEAVFEQIRGSTFGALEALVRLAIEKQVDFVLIAGDVFDENQHSLLARMQLKAAFEKLNVHHIEVYLSYGNHDFTEGSKFIDQFPGNVHVFSDQEVRSIPFQKNGVTVANIYGFSYRERAVTKNKTQEYTIQGEAPYHIAMLHGSLHSNKEHDVYAPFHLRDLTDKEFDYWALGHIHTRDILNQLPPVVYPGNIQGRSKKESGERGCYHVELKNGEAALTFHPLQRIRFESIKVDVSSCKDPQEMVPVIERHLEDCKNRFGKVILHVIFFSNRTVLQDWQQTGYLDETVDFCNEIDRTENKWAYIQGYSVQVEDSWNWEELEKGHHFAGELAKRFQETDNITRYLQPILHHRKARKYLSGFSEEEQSEIKQMAENLLMNQLLKK